MFLQIFVSRSGSLPYETPDEVHNYCEDLIQMGMSGGFMLSSGCEVPLNCKEENIKAFMDSLGRLPK